MYLHEWLRLPILRNETLELNPFFSYSMPCYAFYFQLMIFNVFLLHLKYFLSFESEYDYYSTFNMTSKCECGPNAKRNDEKEKN